MRAGCAIAKMHGDREVASETQEILASILAHNRDLAERLKRPKSLRDLWVPLNKAGRAAQMACVQARTAEAFWAILRVARDLSERLKTPKSLPDLCVSLNINGKLTVKIARFDQDKTLVEEGS